MAALSSQVAGGSGGMMQTTQMAALFMILGGLEARGHEVVVVS